MRKGLSLLLALVMILSAFSSLTLISSADSAYPDGMISLRDEFWAWGVDNYDWENDLGDVLFYLGENCDYWDEPIFQKSYKGISYDEETNTITFDNVTQNVNAFWFTISNMGDVTVELIGTSTLVMLQINDSNVTFTGDGTLILNPAMSWTRDFGTEYEEIHENERILGNAVNANNATVHFDSGVTFINNNDEDSPDPTVTFAFTSPKTTEQLNESVFTFDGNSESEIVWDEDTYTEPGYFAPETVDVQYVLHTFPSTKILKRTDSVDKAQISDYWIVSNIDNYGYSEEYNLRPLVQIEGTNMWREYYSEGFRYYYGTYQYVDPEDGTYNTDGVDGISFEPVTDTSTLPAGLTNNGVTTALLSKKFIGYADNLYTKGGKSYALHSTSFQDFYNGLVEPTVPAEYPENDFTCDLFEIKEIGSVQYLEYIENVCDNTNDKSTADPILTAKGYEAQGTQYDAVTTYYYYITNNPLKINPSSASAGATVNVANEAQLIAALDMETPVSAINITNSFTVSKDCTIKLDPSHINNYSDTVMTIKDGVTLTIAEGGNLGSFWPSYEGDWETPPLPNARVINNGAIIIERGGLTEADFNTNNGSITVKDGGKAVCVTNNNGTVLVENGGSYLTTQGDTTVNKGTITIQEGAVMEARFGTEIINETDGTINLNGKFYCGCAYYNDADHMWFENKGIVNGNGDIILRELTPLENIDGLIETVMVYLGQESRFENWDDINIFKEITVSDFEQLQAATTGERVVAGENVPGDMDTLIVLDNDLTIPENEFIGTMAQITVPEEYTVTVNSGAELECGFVNFGTTEVKSGGMLFTTQGGNIENHNLIVINEGASIKSQMGGEIVNCEDAVLTVNGTLYCGCINYDNADHAWFENQGSVCGSGIFCFNNPLEDAVIPVSDYPELATEIVASLGDAAELKDEYIQLKHIPGEWTVTKEATYTAKGEKVLKCSICGEIIETQEIPYKTGWVTRDGKKYYYANGAMYKSRLVTISGNKYYFGSDGAMYKSKLASIDGKKYYFGSDGVAYKSKLITVSGKKYYIGSDCIAYKSKFASLDGKKYYFGSDCAMVISKLITVDGKKYYMGSDGAMYKSKLASVDGKKYYFGSNGVAYKSKLITVSGKKYYIGSDCVAYKAKFATLDGKKYYFGGDCAMVTSKLITVDSKKYYMGSDGAMYISKLATIDGKKYYFGKDGVAYKSKLITVNGKKYYLGSDCVAYKSKLASVSGKKYYFGSDCAAYKSKFATVGGKKYYFGSDCVMYKSKTFSVGGVKWKADSNGVCKKA